MFPKTQIQLYNRGGIKILLEFIYPTVCGLCNRISKRNICNECELRLKDEFKNHQISYRNKEFNNHIFFCKYEGILREKLLDYKFNNKAYLFRFWAEIIMKNEKEYGIFENYDIITSVPIHKKRKLVRGYNQSELIAKDIAKKYKNLSYIDTLCKIKNTVPQSSLNRKQRSQNIKKAYKAKDVNLKNKKVVLFDDIYTTGETVNECSRLLRKAGAETITVITIAKD